MVLGISRVGSSRDQIFDGGIVPSDALVPWPRSLANAALLPASLPTIDPPKPSSPLEDDASESETAGQTRTGWSTPDFKSGVRSRPRTFPSPTPLSIAFR